MFYSYALMSLMHLGFSFKALSDQILKNAHNLTSRSNSGLSLLSSIYFSILLFYASTSTSILVDLDIDACFGPVVARHCVRNSNSRRVPSIISACTQEDILTLNRTACLYPNKTSQKFCELHWLPLTKFHWLPRAICY